MNEEDLRQRQRAAAQADEATLQELISKAKEIRDRVKTAGAPPDLVGAIVTAMLMKTDELERASK
jgi:hypothetical protein